MQTGVGGVEYLGAIKGQPQNVVVTFFKENVLKVSVIHSWPSLGFKALAIYNFAFCVATIGQSLRFGTCQRLLMHSYLRPNTQVCENSNRGRNYLPTLNFLLHCNYSPTQRCPIDAHLWGISLFGDLLEATPMPTFEVTPRNKVKRLAERGKYDKATIYPIVDEAFICHIGFVEDGQPFVIPTIHVRHEDTIFFHGAKASRMLKHIKAGNPLCVTVTLLDGLVMARSVFHHSMNYRAAVLYGCGRIVDDEAEKLEALRLVSEAVMPGSWDDARQPTRKEMNATTVVAMPIESASAKIRSGPPGDDDEDYALPVWAGVVPIRQQIEMPVADPLLREGVEVPDYMARFVNGRLP
jgi:nitroimidazol reductase NimA-like FMN-containing flavoprotein (pyridoxamine 5'-phosphate oxidase superfamily)